MKRPLFTLFFLLVLGVTGHAQMQKGSWMLDGQAGIDLRKSDEQYGDPSKSDYSASNRVTTFYFLPGAGYFIQDNLALGLSANFQAVSGKGQYGENDPTRANHLTYGLGLFSRKYISAGEKLSFYGDIRLGGFWGNSGWFDGESSDRTVLSKDTGIEGSASLGIQYLVKDFLGVHLQSPLVAYEKSTNAGVAYEGRSGSSNLDVRLFSAFSLGATFFF